MTTDLPPPFRCPHCGNQQVLLRPHDQHGFGVYCSRCERHLRWTGKGKEPKPRNPQHRAQHRADGEMACDLCGITESEAKRMSLHFEIDHRKAQDFGGGDATEDTRPLCSACHYVKTAIEHRTRAERRLLEGKGEDGSD